MKFNQWTLGLAAVGAVSMASAVRADEAKLTPLNTAISSTVISGYVDVAAQYTPGNPGQTAAYNQPYGTDARKVDNFSINCVAVTLEKPLDDSSWASGYRIDLNQGNDAITPLNSNGSDGQTFGMRQGYVALRTPLGNGIDWKVGLFDGVTGYEANTGYLNPNYTHSYGYMVNPGSEAGMIGAYKVCDEFSVQMGMANRQNGTKVGLSSHDYLGTISLTAPESFGFLKGSVLNAGVIQTFDNGGVNNYSVNATLNTPVTGLKFGLCYDKVQYLDNGPSGENYGDGNIYGVYATFQATEKLSFNVRGEYADLPYADATGIPLGSNNKGYEVTTTVQYDLWANVVSRLEFRWDHVDSGKAFNDGNHGGYDGGSAYEGGDAANAYLLALNLVYKF
jgi:hypothetical protein